MMTSRRSFLASLLVLSGCGFHPLYGAGQAAGLLASVSLNNIEGKDGQKLRLLLSDKFYGAQAPTTPAWTLNVAYSTIKQELGIRRDDIATRARLTLKADLTLFPVGQAEPVFTGGERSFVSYNILSDPYATLAAEENATERGLTQLADLVSNRIALYLAGRQP